MRFKNYINEDEENPFAVLGFYQIFDTTNEITDETLVKLQTLGQTMGIKVRRSKTFQEQMKKAGKGVMHLMKLDLDYSIHADIMDSKARNKLAADIKTQFSKVKKHDVISFIVNIDKSFLGLTAIPRHVLQNVLGISITSYDNWETNQDYVIKQLQKVQAVLASMKDEEDVVLIKRVIQNLGGGAT